MQRRNFVKLITFGGIGSFIMKSKSPPLSPPGSPVIISTWDHGKEAVKVAADYLAKGNDVLDVVEAGVKTAEANPGVMSVGYGGLPNAEGIVELDAAIMDGRTLNAGAVASLRNIKHPISVARLVMERTRHVMLVGEGALKFAREYGFKEENLLTEKARERWIKWRENLSDEDDYLPAEENHDTITMIALDTAGNLATACTTSGLAYKIPGRVGDSPLIGAGSYCDNEIGGAGATGVGEEVIKICGSFLVVELMRQGLHPQKACEEALKRMKRRSQRKNFQDCFIAVRKDGEIGAAALQPGFKYALFKNGKHSFLEARTID